MAGKGSAAKQGRIEMHLARQLREVAEGRGISTRAMGAMMGISHSQVSKILFAVLGTQPGPRTTRASRNPKRARPTSTLARPKTVLSASMVSSLLGCLRSTRP